MSANLNEIKEELEKLLKTYEPDIDEEEDGDSDDDWDINGRFGGNMDDAYYGGIRDGEEEANTQFYHKIKKILKKFD